MRIEEIAGDGPAVDDARMTSQPARRTMPASVCHRLQRNRFGRAVTSSLAQHRCWNQRTRSAARHTSCIHARLGVEIHEREPFEPESFKRLMWSSTWA
jgi:hypothetical protein